MSDSTQELDSTRLDGRVAFVTGGGRGVGAGIARLLAARGASVVVNDLGVQLDGTGADAGPAAEVVAEIAAAGGTAVADSSDITDTAAVEKAIASAIDTFGSLDIVVNVAGILRDRMIFNLSGSDWDDVIRVHLRGHYNTTRFAAAYWREQRNPEADYRLINFTSFSGLHGAPGQPNYAAAKMGIVGLTYSSANALAKYGVTVNAISPSADTRMTASVPDERRPGTFSSPERSPDNIAPVVGYIASSASRWLTGQVISARGYEVGLYNRPQIAASIAAPEPWDPARLAAAMERYVKPFAVAQAPVWPPIGS